MQKSTHLSAAQDELLVFLAYETCYPPIWTGLPLSLVSPYSPGIQVLVLNYTWKVPKEVVNQQMHTLKHHAATENMKDLMAERFLYVEKIKQDVSYLYGVASYVQVYIFPFLNSSSNFYVIFHPLTAIKENIYTSSPHVVRL